MRNWPGRPITAERGNGVTGDSRRVSAARRFLNFGRDYAGARDDFVYVYSHDSGDAYIAADRMVLARVARSRIKDKRAYEYFRGRDARKQTGMDGRRRAARTRLQP